MYNTLQNFRVFKTFSALKPKEEKHAVSFHDPA